MKRVPNLQTEFAKIATENIGRHCGDCRDCWDCLECRFWQNCRGRRDFRPRLQGFPIVPAENGWLHAETTKIDELAGRDCRDCRPKMPRVAGLLRVPNFQSEIAESPGQDCWDCSGDCRPTLERLQRLLGVPRMQIIQGWSRLPRLSPQIAGVTGMSGREWVIACWDWKKDKIAGRKCRDSRDCWDCRYCRPRMRDCKLRQKKMTRLPDGINVIAESAAQNCRDCRGCW